MGGGQRSVDMEHRTNSFFVIDDSSYQWSVVEVQTERREEGEREVMEFECFLGYKRRA